MKRLGVFIIMIFLAATITGCDAMQRKFTRKKTVVKQPHFYQLKKYKKKPSPELYKQHYAYWASWQEEMVQFIGQNHKKDERSIEEAIGHLKDMQNILIPSKAEELQPHIERMEGAKEIIFRGELSFANKDYIRSTIEREDRLIKREFCYNKVKDSLRKSFDEEAPPQLSMAAGKEEHGGSEK
jgi:formate dehydrogenase maturation protein FdhE